MVLSNTTLSSIQDTVRSSALESFEFFSNHVMGSMLSEELCSYVRDVLRDEEDTLIRTKQPRALAVALHAWFVAQGVSVLTNIQLPRHEILNWLDLAGDTNKTASVAVVLELQQDGVKIQWV